MRRRLFAMRGAGLLLPALPIWPITRLQRSSIRTSRSSCGNGDQVGSDESAFLDSHDVKGDDGRWFVDD